MLPYLFSSILTGGFPWNKMARKAEPPKKGSLENQTYGSAFYKGLRK